MEKELKSNLLEMLLFVDAFCKENQIGYFITGGTLRGALEKSDFLDDDKDADIGMLRSDYERFVACFLYNKDDSPFYAENYLTNPSCCFLYTKIRPIKVSSNNQDAYIDIYPFDCMPKSVVKQHFQLIKKKFFSGLLFYFYNKKRLNAVQKFIFGFFAIFYKSGKTIYEKANNNLVKYNDKKNLVYVCGLEGGHGNKESLSFNDALSTKSISFSNHIFPAPNNPEDFVKRMYKNR